MNKRDKELKTTDSGEIRSGTDRRKSRYSAYIPERRSGRNRRKGFNRRELTRYEARRIGEHEWHKISEKAAMESLVDSFDPVNPIIARILRGEEITTSQEIFRIIK